MWDASQPLLLLLIYLLLFVPFFFAAVYVCLMFTRFGEQAGRVYGFDILGAAAGCLGVVLALFLLPPMAVLAVVAVCSFVASALVWARVRRGGLGIAGCAAAATALAWALAGPLGELRVSPYKELSQTLEVIGTGVAARDLRSARVAHRRGKSRRAVSSCAGPQPECAGRAASASSRCSPTARA